MFEQLQQIDTSLFLFLNGHHTSSLDYPMWLISGHLPWIILYVFIIYLSIKKYGKRALIVIPFLVLTFIFADIASNFIKHSFQRYRPSHNFLIKDTIHIISGYRGGMYGFVSSHAANTFGVATLVILLLKNKYSFLFLFWPVIVSYSRIYLGVHYPSDIIGGAITGIIIAFILYLIFIVINKKFYPKEVT